MATVPKSPLMTIGSLLPSVGKKSRHDPTSVAGAGGIRDFAHFDRCLPGAPVKGKQKS
jgi:hypothetical protein